MMVMRMMMMMMMMKGPVQISLNLCYGNRLTYLFSRNKFLFCEIYNFQKYKFQVSFSQFRSVQLFSIENRCVVEIYLLWLNLV